MLWSLEVLPSWERHVSLGMLASVAQEAAGTPEEVIVALASTDMKIANGDVSGAMR